MSLTFSLQALLVRHEAYMAEAEEERSKLIANVNKLEAENKHLEATNTRIIEENRGLLNQLEDINDTVTESNAQVQTLTTTLNSRIISLCSK